MKYDKKLLELVEMIKKHEMTLTYDDAGFYIIEPFNFFRNTAVNDKVLSFFITENDSVLFAAGSNYKKFEESSSFIEQRIKYQNHDLLDTWLEEYYKEYYKEKKVPLTIWFETKTPEEIRWGLEYNTLYACLIIGKDNKFEDFRYYINLCEDDIFYLGIRTNDKQHFINSVIPKLQANFPNLVVEGLV